MSFLILHRNPGYEVQILRFVYRGRQVQLRARRMGHSDPFELGLRVFSHESGQHPYYPGNAEDEAKIIGVNETHTIPPGMFESVIRTAEKSALEPDGLEHKFYAPGVGKIFTHKVDVDSGEIFGGEQLVSFVPESGSGLLCFSGIVGLLMAGRRIR